MGNTGSSPEATSRSCAARRLSKPTCKAPSSRQSREYFGPLYPTAGGNGAADGRFVALGLAAYRLLPVAALPSVNYPTIQVSAQLPGADPQTMASSVATPLEQQFSQIPGVTQLTSSSALGVTQLTIQFDLSRDVDSAAEDVLAAINAASPYLPLNIPYPRPSAKLIPRTLRS